LQLIPNLTLTVDADVLQADGGTRTAAITGGYVALRMAIKRMLEEGLITQSPIVRVIAAVSVGLVNGLPYLDLDYSEDKVAEVDFNVVMDSEGQLIELQGTGETGTFSRAQLNSMLDLAETGIKELFQKQLAVCG
jgi:ribonuclease PH